MSCIQPTALAPCFSKAYFNVIFSSTPRHSKLSLLFRFTFKNIVWFHGACCMLHAQPLSGWLDYCNNWRVVQMITQFSPSLCNFLSFRCQRFRFHVRNTLSLFRIRTHNPLDAPQAQLWRFVHVGLFCPPHIVLLRGSHALWSPSGFVYTCVSSVAWFSHTCIFPHFGLLRTSEVKSFESW